MNTESMNTDGRKLLEFCLFFPILGKSNHTGIPVILRAPYMDKANSFQKQIRFQ